MADQDQVTLICTMLGAYLVAYHEWDVWRRLVKGRGRGMRMLRAPARNLDSERSVILRRLFFESDDTCHEQLRMHRNTFHSFCSRLKGFGLSDSLHVKVEEQVAIFLYTVGHDRLNCSSVMPFLCSSETISHHFHQVLNAVMRLYQDVVRNATDDNSPGDYPYEQHWHHHFKGAVGVVDATHFDTNVPVQDQGRYRNWNGLISQNVLVACTFDMRFTYVLAGWEGSAHDDRLLRCAVTRDGQRLTVPEGKYYLADAGFALVPGFLTPYRGVRYNLSEQGNAPGNAKEMYNFYHSSLRTVVERTIGVLKKRFMYLQNSPFHDVRTHSRIILACCAIHNWLLSQDPNDHLFEFELDDNSEEEEEEEEDFEDEVVEGMHMPTERSNAWIDFRDQLAETMWNEY